VAARNKLFKGELPAGISAWPDDKPNSAFISESLVLTKLSRLLDAEERKIYINNILNENSQSNTLDYPSDSDSNATPIPSPKSRSGSSDSD